MKRACVIGWPVEHSRSPAIHGFWLQHYGIDGTYGRQAVPPETAAAFIASLADRGLSGCNVTVPLKEIAYHAAAERDAAAIAVGAVNTVWVEHGRIVATNTDTYGFMAHLSGSVPEWNRRDAPVIVLGAGGAARAIVHGFMAAGVERIGVVNRTHARAEAVAAHFGPKVKAYDWAERSVRARDAAVLVNATSIGMKSEGSLGMDFLNFDERCVVCDIVYVPLETGLLRDARRKGLRTVDGLGMLLHQAVPGFEKWFGRRPEVTEDLRRLIVSDIEGR